MRVLAHIGPGHATHVFDRTIRGSGDTLCNQVMTLRHRGVFGPGSSPNGERPFDPAGVTCKKCLRKLEREAGR